MHRGIDFYSTCDHQHCDDAERKGPGLILTMRNGAELGLVGFLPVRYTLNLLLCDGYCADTLYLPAMGRYMYDCGSEHAIR